MVDKFQIEKGAGRCAKTDVEIAEGEAYFAVLFEEGEGFRREEYSVDAWDGPPDGAYCYFKTRRPVAEKKKRLFVDNEVLMTFFRRLNNETDLARLQFRFVLALILMRKRLLRYEETTREDEREVWSMRVGKTEEVHAVLNPRLTDAEIEGVSRQLGVILHGDMGEFDADRDDSDEPAEEQKIAGQAE